MSSLARMLVDRGANGGSPWAVVTLTPATQSSACSWWRPRSPGSHDHCGNEGSVLVDRPEGTASAKPLVGFAVPVDNGPVAAEAVPQHAPGHVVEPEAAVDEHATPATALFEVVGRMPPHEGISERADYVKSQRRRVIRVRLRLPATPRIPNNQSALSLS